MWMHLKCEQRPINAFHFILCTFCICQYTMLFVGWELLAMAARGANGLRFKELHDSRALLDRSTLPMICTSFWRCIPISIHCSRMNREKKKETPNTIYKWNSFLIYKRSELVFSSMHEGNTHTHSQQHRQLQQITQKRKYNQAQIASGKKKKRKKWKHCRLKWWTTILVGRFFLFVLLLSLNCISFS